MNNETLQLAKSLIEKPSITPLDADCQTLIAERLKAMGFTIYSLPSPPVHNLFAVYGNTKPMFAFAGHTDVVPTGPLSEWRYPPFQPTIEDGFLYGRGAADMKGSLAAMITATERFLKKNPNPKGSIAFLITSDEEGEAIHGTKKIMEHLLKENIQLNFCIVGEPTSLHHLGDTIKIGRRGSMTGHLKILGQQGHIAYPHKALNPIHCTLLPLHNLINTAWCEGNQNFPPTSFQISNIKAGTGAGNVIPGELECQFNFRFSPELTADSIQEQVKNLLNDHGLNYKLEWQLFGNPFLTPLGTLTESCIQAINNIMNIQAKTSTDGGTSDARFIASKDTQVIELGPNNATIHAINERVSIQELENLSLIYEEVLNNLL